MIMHRLWQLEREEKTDLKRANGKEKSKLNKRKRNAAYDLPRKITWLKEKDTHTHILHTILKYNDDKDIKKVKNKLITVHLISIVFNCEFNGRIFDIK